MKCQSLFSGENKKNISECRLIKYLPRMLSFKYPNTKGKYSMFIFFLYNDC